MDLNLYQKEKNQTEKADNFVYIIPVQNEKLNGKTYLP